MRTPPDFALPTGNLTPDNAGIFVTEMKWGSYLICFRVLYSMGAITYSNFFVLGIWMGFIPCALGQLDSDQGIVHYKQSSVNIPRFRSSNDAEVLFHRRQTVGCNINYIVRFLEGLCPIPYNALY
jgi:hypothetical protein